MNNRRATVFLLVGIAAIAFGLYHLSKRTRNIATTATRNSLCTLDLADVNFHDADGFYADVSYSGIVGSLFGSSHMGVSAILVPRESIAK